MTSVEIYTRQYCSYCHFAKQLLSRKGVEFREIDVTGNEDLRQHMAERTQGRTTLPQIFIGSTYVGGCDELYALEDAGKLDPLLNGDQPA
jgi:glutaredoxin 3